MLAFISEKKRQINLRRDKDGMVQDAFCAHVPLTIPRLPLSKGKRKAPKSLKNELVFPFGVSEISPGKRSNFESVIAGNLDEADVFEEPWADRAFAVMVQRGDEYLGFSSQGT